MLYPQTFGNSVEMRFERILSKSKLMPSFMKVCNCQKPTSYLCTCTCRSSRGDPTPFCLSTSHCYEEKSYIKWPAGRHEFSELFKRPIYHFEFFTYVAKEGRGKNRGNYNSGHRLHAKDFFGNNFAISQGDINEGNLAEIFRQEGKNEGGLLSSIQLGGISFISHLKGWKRK